LAYEVFDCKFMLLGNLDTIWQIDKYARCINLIFAHFKKCTLSFACETFESFDNPPLCIDSFIKCLKYLHLKCKKFQLYTFCNFCFLCL
jgi:hypothetical protein